MVILMIKVVPIYSKYGC